MNILYTITRYWPAIGGAELMLREIALRLSGTHRVSVAAQINTNHDNWLLSPTLEAPSEQVSCTDGNVTVQLIPPTSAEKKILFQFIARPALRIFEDKVSRYLYRRKLRKLAPGIDIFHNFHIGKDYLSAATYDIARSNDKPFAFTPFFHPGENRITPLFQFLCRSADLVFVLSENEKSVIANERGTDNGIVRISTGPVLAEKYDLQEFLRQYNPEGAPMVLFLGQKLPYKGYDRLLKAAELVWEKFPGTRFLFAGPDTPQSNNIFRKYDDPRIINLGKIDLETKTAALAAADLLCQPSLQESFGAVFLEAWSMAKPVIGGNIPSIQEVIDDGKTGFLVSDNVTQIAEKIISLLENNDLRLNMGNAGKQKLIDFHSWDSICQSIESSYKNILHSEL